MTPDEQVDEIMRLAGAWAVLIATGAHKDIKVARAALLAAVRQQANRIAAVSEEKEMKRIRPPITEKTRAWWASIEANRIAAVSEPASWEAEVIAAATEKERNRCLLIVYNADPDKYGRTFNGACQFIEEAIEDGRWSDSPPTSEWNEAIEAAVHEIACIIVDTDERDALISAIRGLKR